MIRLRNHDDRFPSLGIQLVRSFRRKVILHYRIQPVTQQENISLDSERERGDGHEERRRTVEVFLSRLPLRNRIAQRHRTSSLKRKPARRVTGRSTVDGTLVTGPRQEAVVGTSAVMSLDFVLVNCNKTRNQSADRTVVREESRRGERRDIPLLAVISPVSARAAFPALRERRDARSPRRPTAFMEFLEICAWDAAS